MQQAAFAAGKRISNLCFAFVVVVVFFLFSPAVGKFFSSVISRLKLAN
jgi:hypothetical protein